MMLKTYLGPVEAEEGVHYLRPETAQGIFVNFLNVLNTSRRKPPFGIAQTGKSFRNEITPGNFIFRTREFEQMEMEFFVEPGTDEKWHEYWLEERWNWYVEPRHRPGEPALLRAPEGEAQPLLEADGRHRVPVRVRRHRVRRARGHRQPHRLRPHHAQQALRRRPDLLRPGQRPALHARTSSSRPPGSPARRSRSCSMPTPRTRRPTPRARWRSAPCCGSTSGSPRSRRRCCRCPATPTCRRRHATSPPRCASELERRVRRRAGDRAPLPPPGRDRHAVLRHRRLRHPRRQRGDRARARLDGAGAHRDRPGRGLPRRAAARLLMIRFAAK